MIESKTTIVTSRRLAKATQAIASRLPSAAVRSSADCTRVSGRLPEGLSAAELAKQAGAAISWAYSTPGGVGKHEQGIVSGTVEGLDFLATETGPADGREAAFEIFATESDSAEHGRQWLAKLSVLDRIVTNPEELAGFITHMLSRLKGKKKSEAAAAILRAVSESLDG
ncbi:hypothetical protein [Aquimonas sp.]|jgi:hypothetical protein|uniref:hypothetical protein n=1 Tax=Aquimonas sp. TaxID=1872588 RepID=UPI0037BEECE4